MNTQKLADILKQLEGKRDVGLTKFSSKQLEDRFFLMQINIFTSTFFYALTELKAEMSDIFQIYLAYIKSKHNSVRFLIEMYLTVAHVAALPAEERFTRVYSFALSEKINLYKLDLELHRLMNNELTATQLADAQKEYKNFIDGFGKLTDKIPEKISDFFTDGKLPKEVGTIFGFEYSKHNKINYINEIMVNPFISKSVREQLLLSYPMLSGEVHPTISSSEDFEVFIAKPLEEKRNHILPRLDYFGTTLKLVGERMLVLSDKLLSEK